MDLDATLRNLPLTEEQVKFSINKICSINLNDDIHFELISVTDIRKKDIYGGFSVRIDAIFEKIVTPLKIDISTGDVITPSAVEYEFSGIFDDTVNIRLWGYNIETVLAEKVETILSRGITSTRPRDFYDVYILTTTQKFDINIFKTALEQTSKHRGSFEKTIDTNAILISISENDDLKINWNKYQKQFSYAKEITYNDILEKLSDLLKK